MARLIGAQRLVLQAVRDLPADAAGYVTESQIAQKTQIAPGDVRDWIETLEGDGYLQVARTMGGLTVSITPQGKLVLRQFEPIGQPPPPAVPPSDGPGHVAPTPPGGPLAENAAVRTILILAANPSSTERLRLDEEVKKIEQGLERSRRRDQFRLVVKWAVTDDDLRRALLDHEPEIVHFSGHGAGTGQGVPGTGRDLIPPKDGDPQAGGLAFEDDHGRVHLIPGDALARLFELCSDSVKCVVLNACYSEAQAEAIGEHINFVVGMRKAIGDDAAIKFAVGFYDALGAGRDIEKAFRFGCSAVDLKGIPEYLTPVLKKKS
jgi:hypothetical protein